MKDVVLSDNISRLLSIVKDKTGMDLSYCDSNTTKVTTVYIKSGAKYLSEAGYVDLPSNAYVNKQITGAGATFVGKTIQQKHAFVENAPGMAYDLVNIVSIPYRFCLDFCSISYYF